MTNTQIIFQLIGWSFILFLHNRTIKRTEISRLKDQLVDLIDDVGDWVRDEINEEYCSKVSFERAYTAKIARLDVLIQQLNGLAKCKLLNENLLLEFWNLDVEEIFINEKVDKIYRLQEKVVEAVEASYHAEMFNKNFFRKVWLNYKPEAFGALLSVLIVYYLFEVLDKIYG